MKRLKLPLPKRTQHTPDTGRRGSTVRPEATVDRPTYRRNRTMTDRSTIPEVSERARIHQLRAIRRKIGITFMVVVAGIVVLIVCFSQFSGSVSLTFQKSDVIVKEVEDTTYQAIFNDYYQKHPFERFRFVTNYNQLLATLQLTAPEVASLRSTGIDGLGVSRYELILRQPVASWQVADTRYYVDAEGVTFTKNYYPEPSVVVMDNSGAQIARGEAVASNRLLSFVGRVVALASEKSIKITSIEIPEGSMRQLHLKGKGMPMIRMTIDRSVEEQVGNMQQALIFLKQKHLSPQYIDVRVSGKAFYK